MRFSTAKELITPYYKVQMSGYASRDELYASIHDDLYVKCVYMENNNTKTMIIAYDLLQYNYILNEAVFDYIKTNYMIEKENVIISYSHTHAGPKIASYTERHTSSPLYEFYLERTLRCIDRAFSTIMDGTLSMGETTGRWNINRRCVTEKGIALAPNYEGITDDELSVLVIKDSSSHVKAVLYNYSCHPVTLSGTLHLSGEFPGRINQLIEANYYGCNCLFLQGAAGNMRPKITAYGDHFNACTFDQVDEMSKAISDSIFKLISSQKMENIKPTFRGCSFTVKPAIQPLDRSFFEKRLTEVSGYLIQTIQNLLDHFDEQDDFALIHCGFIKLTDQLYIVYMGGEICYEVKLLIREVFEHKKIIFLGYHEALTYIPSDKIIDEGGYEGIEAPTFSSFRGPFALGINETIKNAFKEKLF
ncbi:MAG: neutral/alkaline non-lysosomal ceramidase N-terminal domain-containing protein [Clostridia bacterium]|nr:neutral/alkaline non-lysosomal ceramidase N-terminal domain-containing protein [Clostridia bacterium]